MPELLQNVVLTLKVDDELTILVTHERNVSVVWRDAGSPEPTFQYLTRDLEMAKAYARKLAEDEKKERS